MKNKSRQQKTKLVNRGETDRPEYGNERARDDDRMAPRDCAMDAVSRHSGQASSNLAPSTEPWDEAGPGMRIGR